MREWKTHSKISEGWVQCTEAEFAIDPLPAKDKQCFCEVKPKVSDVRCADEGD